MTPHSHRAHPQRIRGFTQLELVVVLVLLGILSFVVLPKMSDSSAFQTIGFRDEVIAALRMAQKTAVSHRRLVCATLTSTTVTLNIATNNGDSNCSTTVLKGPDGQNAYARSLNTDAATLTPTGTIYFQPSGLITSDGAGTTPSDYTLTISNLPDINVVGTTGYVY